MTYRLHLVCAGSGSARLRFEPAGAGAATAVPCDGSVVQRRLTGDELVRIDVAGAKGATGVIAGQIDAMQSSGLVWPSRRTHAGGVGDSGQEASGVRCTRCGRRAWVG